ncbi:MAG TPA: family 20 glycosylhydrolase [Candidatus Lokiarchaeia archaeon]|nr:family 20 glycosylhydrolase [Candidatus Lokiarchaeia archaeon]
MNVEFLPVPKEFHPGEGSFQLRDSLNCFVNKAKVQDHVADFFGFLWRNFKINMKITAIRDRDFKDEYENGFFMYITAADELSPDFPSVLMQTLETIQPGDGYLLRVTNEAVFIVSKSMSGFFHGVVTFQQAGESFALKKDQATKKPVLEIPTMDINDFPDLEMRAVHVDLKVQLHSLDYLKNYVRLMARYKINAIVWEWEDKFPYKKHPDVKHPIAFNHDETADLMELCQVYGIECIPLVQTFGHLEFILKHEQYAHLKESRDMEHDPNRTLDICPLHEETLPLLQDMIADIVSYHPKSRFIHVGGDEVYTIGSCDKCKAFIEENGNGDEKVGKSKLYISHMNNIARIVKGFGKIPMIWHDYLLKYPDFIDDFDKDVVIVYWMYGKDKNPQDFAEEIKFFKEKGFKVLAASSVNSDFQFAIPNYDLRIQNIYELNRALGQIPEGNVGALLTNWPVCRAPIDTTLPGMLFFAENTWNIPAESYSAADVANNFTIKLLKRLFLVRDNVIKKHVRAFSLLQASTTIPRLNTDLAALDSNLGDAIDSWEVLMTDANNGKNIVEAIIHGLKLQRFKIQVNILGNIVLHEFDGDDLPTLESLKAVASNSEQLTRDMELLRFATKELYEKIMYDEEVGIELKLRFEKPLAYLKRVMTFTKELPSKFRVIAELLADLMGKSEALNINDLSTTITGVLDAFSGKLSNAFQSGGNLPGIDDLERMNNLVEMSLASMEETLTEMFQDFLKATKELRDEIDDFLLEIAKNSMEPNFLGKF